MCLCVHVCLQSLLLAANSVTASWKKCFRRKVAGAKMLILEPLRKHSFGHKNAVYALGWHVIGADGEKAVEMARLLWVRDTEWLLEQ